MSMAARCWWAESRRGIAASNSIMASLARPLSVHPVSAQPLSAWRSFARPLLSAAFALTLFSATPSLLYGQASEIPSAAPTSGSMSPEQHGRQLLDQMVVALGGPAWTHRRTASVLGRTATFFRSQPTGITINFAEYFQYPAIPGTTESAPRGAAERIEFISPKGVILPGTKRDVVQVWTADQGYELTYKGKTTLPREQVEDYLRRRNHGIDALVTQWLTAPGVVIVYEGPGMSGRRAVDTVSVLSANNDAITVELDQTTHLPLARSFRWRNEQFKDYDQDREEYDAYQTYGGVQTPLTISRYRNGDLVNQRFFTKIEYNAALPATTFDPDAPLVQKKH